MLNDLIARFPDISKEAISKYFSLFEKTYTCYYGAGYGKNSCDDEIILHLMAHLISNSDNTKNGDTAKPVSSESVGSVSVSYVQQQNITAMDAFFSTTPYGQVYLMLIKNNGIGAIFV